MNAIREILQDLERSEAANAGLLLSRYLESFDDNNKEIKSRTSLMNEAVSATVRTKPLYEKGFEKWKNYLGNLPATKTDRMFTQGRMVHGLGSQNVLEAGITLHHLYGTPIIPGSSLKGVASHYCNEVWSLSDERFKEKGEYHNILFGTQESAGHIIFHDGWIIPSSLKTGVKTGLVMDIMTTHHPHYYSGDAAPTDYDSPVPISFLSVHGEFLIAVSCDVQNEMGEKWSELALNLLKETLIQQGVGGKTSSGYGRFCSDGKESSGNSSPGGKADVSFSVNQYNNGDKVLFTRIEDSKKGKPRFQADDGFTGNITSGGVPSVEIGETVTLEIVSVNVKGKNYILKYSEK
jgi:CRISPR-associated protein Cmr6